MEHREIPPDVSADDRLRILLRQLVVDWRLAASGPEKQTNETLSECADDLEALLDENA